MASLVDELVNVLVEEEKLYTILLECAEKKTQILVDGKWDNYEGYLRTLKFQSDKILEIEYHKYSDKKVKKLNLADNGFVSVIFKKEYANKIILEM